MHKSLALVLGVLTLGQFAVAAEYKVEVKPEANNVVEVHFQTTRINSAMCHLETRRLTLDLGNRTLNAAVQSLGRIEVEASVDPLKPCLTAFGPHRGMVSLQLGYGLPQLVKGSYELVINGEKAGNLVVSSNGARLDD